MVQVSRDPLSGLVSEKTLSSAVFGQCDTDSSTKVSANRLTRCLRATDKTKIELHGSDQATSDAFSYVQLLFKRCKENTLVDSNVKCLSDKEVKRSLDGKSLKVTVGVAAIGQESQNRTFWLDTYAQQKLNLQVTTLNEKGFFKKTETEFFDFIKAAPSPTLPGGTDMPTAHLTLQLDPLSY